MVKLVDTRDLKSRARKGVPVRFRLRAPHLHVRTAFSCTFRTLKQLGKTPDTSHRTGDEAGDHSRYTRHLARAGYHGLSRQTWERT
jgi:hypothetical protein